MKRVQDTQIQYHSEWMEQGKLAVNVKVYGLGHKVDDLYPFFARLGYSEDSFAELVEQTFDQLAQDFWEFIIQDIGKKYGFDQVYSEGRMGGWAVPHINGKPIHEDDLTAEIKKNYLKFKVAVKKEVDSATDIVYNELVTIWQEKEIAFLRQHSLMVKSTMNEVIK